MKSAIDWFREKGFGFDDKITIKDVIDLQNDARSELVSVLKALMPFVMEDYYPNCAAPEYKKAVEAAIDACGMTLEDYLQREEDNNNRQ